MHKINHKIILCSKINCKIQIKFINFSGIQNLKCNRSDQKQDIQVLLYYYSNFKKIKFNEKYF